MNVGCLEDSSVTFGWWLTVMVRNRKRVSFLNSGVTVPLLSGATVAHAASPI